MTPSEPKKNERRLDQEKLFRLSCLNIPRAFRPLAWGLPTPNVSSLRPTPTRQILSLPLVTVSDLRKLLKSPPLVPVMPESHSMQSAPRMPPPRMADILPITQRRASIDE